MRSVLIAIALALPNLAAMAQDQTPQPQIRAAASVERSQLSGGLDDWTEYSVGLSRRSGPRDLMEASLLETRRFGIKDTQLSAGFSRPLSSALTLSADASISSTHRVLAQHALGAVLQYEFAHAWLVHGGYRHTRYDNTNVQRGTIRLEHYFGNFSASAGWYPVRALGTRADSFDARAAWYYAQDSSVGIAVARGDEATQVGAGAIVMAPVRSVAISGRHALGPRLSLNWSLFRSEQGTFYTRKGFYAGVQAAF
ncbi:YaiO family outer membrane beta-barrel protein [Ottowia caeni]|uniref:YaiO family outer membrane beta-barrel protein n=1 Tax=Ottowia caeni TaxID=2870339 RepID=UPI001E5DFC92|nr:YaiO family outer membrane beta-barrel protein [Ottowia caeni]